MLEISRLHLQGSGDMDVTSGPHRHSERHEADEGADSKPPHYLQKLTEEAEKLAAEVGPFREHRALSSEEPSSERCNIVCTTIRMMHAS